nr:tetratricopeptide repeat protein [Bryobacter sp.]
MTNWIGINIVAAAFCAAFALNAQQPGSAESLLQAATKREVVDGDLAGAIAGYQKALAAAKGNRAVAAKALYQLAQCYRKQGNAEARKTLERLVREFGDQPVAAQARTQLAALGEAPQSAGIRLRKLFNEGELGCSSVSLDGKKLACGLEWVNEAAIYDLETGQTRVLTQFRKEEPKNRYMNTFALSRDGKWFAMHTYRAGAVGSELNMIATDGTGSLRTIYKHPQGRWLDIIAWSPDNREILFIVAGKRPAPNTVMAVNIADGRTRTLREVNFALQWSPASVSPDGKWLALSVPGAEALSSDVVVWSIDGAVTTPVLATPAREQVVGWTPDGKYLLAASDRDDSDSIYRVAMANGKPAAAPELVRANVGRIQTLGFDAKGTYYYNVSRTDADLFSVAFDPRAGAITGPESRLSNRNIGKQGFAAWSPEGSQLAMWTYSGAALFSVSNPQLTVRPLRGGPETIVSPDKKFYAYHTPVWDAAGKSLTMLTPETTPNHYRLSRLDPATGRTAALSDPFVIQNIGLTPEWTRDGRYLFQRIDQNIVRKELSTGQERTIWKGAVNQGNIRNLSISLDGKRLA